jgi:putative transposase
MIFDRHPEYKKRGGGRHFWATGYYVDTVGRNEEQILKYITEQDEADRLHDS